MKTLRKVAAAAMAALACALAPVATAQTTLLFSHIFPAQHALVTQVLRPWARDVEQATAGRVKIDFAPSSLAPPPKQLDMVQEGIADIGLQFAGVIPNRMHFELLTELPGTAGTSAQMSRALWATHERHFSKAGEYKRVHLLGLITFPQQDFFCIKPCPATLEDMKGMKILTTPSTSSRQFGALTSGIVAVPAVRYFEPVSKGVVDAYAGTTVLDALSLNLVPHTKAMLKFKDLGTAGSFALVVNDAKWRRISPEDRKAVMGVSGAALASRMAVLDEAVTAASRKILEGGVAVQEASAQLNGDLKNAYAFLEEEWVKEAGKRGIDGAAALRFYREQVVK